MDDLRIGDKVCLTGQIESIRQDKDGVSYGVKIDKGISWYDTCSVKAEGVCAATRKET